MTLCTCGHEHAEQCPKCLCMVLEPVGAPPEPYDFWCGGLSQVVS